MPKALGSDGRLSYLKCIRCRSDKAKCLPEGRQWPGPRCLRCERFNYTCSRSSTKAEQNAALVYMGHSSNLIPGRRQSTPSAIQISKAVSTEEHAPQHTDATVDTIGGISSSLLGANESDAFGEVSGGVYPARDTESAIPSHGKSVDQIITDLGDLTWLARCQKFAPDHDLNCRRQRLMEELNRRAYMYKQDKLVTQLLYVREQQRRLQALGHRSSKIERYFHQPVGLEPVWNEEAALLYLDRQNYFQAELIMEEIVMRYQIQQKTTDPVFSHIITQLVALYKLFDRRIQATENEHEDMSLIARKSVMYRVAHVDSEELCAHVFDAGGIGFHGAFDSGIGLHFAALHNACNLARRAFDCGDSLVSNSHQDLSDGQEGLYGVRSSFHLHTATEHGSIDMVKLLLARGFDIEASMNVDSGDTPLHKAAVGGSLDILVHLLSKGANIEARRKDQKTPLILAASHGKFDVVQYLLERGARIDNMDVDGCTALHWATVTRNTDMMKLLLRFQAGLEARGMPGMTALHCAARLKSVGAVECIEALIDDGLDIDAKDDSMETPLHKACQRGNHEAVKTLLRRGAATSPLARKGTPLHEAVNIWNLHDRISTIRTLVEHVCRRDLNIQRSCDGRTPLHAAVRNLRTFGRSNMVVLECLWSHGADVNLKDSQLKSSLDYAEDFRDAKRLMKQEQQVRATNILHLIEKPE